MTYCSSEDDAIWVTSMTFSRTASGDWRSTILLPSKGVCDAAQITHGIDTGS